MQAANDKEKAANDKENNENGNEAIAEENRMRQALMGQGFGRGASGSRGSRGGGIVAATRGRGRGRGRGGDMKQKKRGRGGAAVEKPVVVRSKATPSKRARLSEVLEEDMHRFINNEDEDDDFVFEVPGRKHPQRVPDKSKVSGRFVLS